MESTGKRLAEIADSNPVAVIAYLVREHRRGQLDDATLLELAQVFRHAGVDLIALLVANPEATEELLRLEAAALRPHVDCVCSRILSVSSGVSRADLISVAFDPSDRQPSEIAFDNTGLPLKEYIAETYQ